MPHEGSPPLPRPSDPEPSPVSPHELLAFLTNPDSYPHHPPQVHIVQTHASYVALAPPWVYKVKKPVNLGFLDYSTLERRHHFLRRELELNRRLAPGIYRRILPITRSPDGKLRFGTNRLPVEYALQMRYIPEEWVLRYRLQQGRHAVRPADIRRIIRSIVRRLYTGQHPSPEVLEWGTLERLRISTDENFDQTRPFVRITISPLAYELIYRYTEAMYEQAASLFQRRLEHKRILECHGDLHSEHIAYTERRILVYDCIEFNERFRCIDVANDIAFLAMDLDYYGYPTLSAIALETAATLLRDPDIQLLADFYKCYRAYVRGKVESFRGTSPGIPERERASAYNRARRYFQLALRYATVGSGPTVLVIMGPIGSGKTTLARAIAQELGWQVVSSDSVRKTLAGLPALEPSPEWLRPWLYSPEMTRRTYRQLWESTIDLLSLQGGAIIDATFARQELRASFMHQAQRHAIRPLFVELSAPAEILRQRIVERRGKTTDSDAGIREFERLTPRYEPPDELPRDYLLHCRSMSPTQELCRTVLLHLMDQGIHRVMGTL
ncbi:MAG: AAA family ATPase [Candidatus Kapabacteria bacterium]|nr:AAA family ATPase [Candidatus Kapabacteria bacterium]MDW8225228.1 AAA family ATPase [Bacteroidota bacterium]